MPRMRIGLAFAAAILAAALAGCAPPPEMNMLELGLEMATGNVAKVTMKADHALIYLKQPRRGDQAKATLYQIPFTKDDALKKRLIELLQDSNITISTE